MDALWFFVLVKTTLRWEQHFLDQKLIHQSKYTLPYIQLQLQSLVCMLIKAECSLFSSIMFAPHVYNNGSMKGSY